MGDERASERNRRHRIICTLKPKPVKSVLKTRINNARTKYPDCGYFVPIGNTQGKCYVTSAVETAISCWAQPPKIYKAKPIVKYFDFDSPLNCYEFCLQIECSL